MVPFLVPGRLIHVKTDKEDWGWGILVSFSKQRITAKNKSQFKSKQSQLSEIKESTEATYILDVYLYSKDKLTSDAFLQAGNPLKQDGRLGIVPVALHPTTISAISTIQLNLPNNHRDADSAKTVELMYLELLKRFEGGKTLKTLHPINDMEIEFDHETDQMDIRELLDAREKVNDQLQKPDVKQLSQA